MIGSDRCSEAMENKTMTVIVDDRTVQNNGKATGENEMRRETRQTIESAV